MPYSELVDFAPGLQVEEIATMALVAVAVVVDVDSPDLAGWKVVEADLKEEEELETVLCVGETASEVVLANSNFEMPIVETAILSVALEVELVG